MTVESQADGRKGGKPIGSVKDGKVKPRASANGTSSGRLANNGSNMILTRK